MTTISPAPVIAPIRHPLLARRRVRWTIQLISFVIFVALWQYAGTRPGMFAVAPPSKVVPELWQAVISGDILRAASGTLLTAAAGYALAVTIGIALGALIGLSVWGSNTIEPIISAFYAAPISLFVPIIGVYVGFDFNGRVFLVFFWALFAVVVNTFTGIRDTPSALVEMAQSFGASRLKIARSIVFPAALPQIVTGLRMAVGRALRGAVAAEVLLALTNLGRFINEAASTFNMPRMLAGILFVVILGTALMKLAEFAENRLMKWWLHSR